MEKNIKPSAMREIYEILKSFITNLSPNAAALIIGVIVGGLIGILLSLIF